MGLEADMSTHPLPCLSMETLVRRYIRALGQCRTRDAKNLMYLMRALYPEAKPPRLPDQLAVPADNGLKSP